ncbi:MAG: hypothetical protein JWN20_2259 [Jatrophihabitantaceae bacterium]|nr:hypothetical protein [Jatrophihabitantaceae bacterium]
MQQLHFAPRNDSVSRDPELHDRARPRRCHAPLDQPATRLTRGARRCGSQGGRSVPAQPGEPRPGQQHFTGGFGPPTSQALRANPCLAPFAAYACVLSGRSAAGGAASCFKLEARCPASRPPVGCVSSTISPRTGRRGGRRPAAGTPQGDTTAGRRPRCRSRRASSQRRSPTMPPCAPSQLAASHKRWACSVPSRLATAAGIARAICRRVKRREGVLRSTPGLPAASCRKGLQLFAGPSLHNC